MPDTLANTTEPRRHHDETDDGCYGVDRQRETHSLHTSLFTKAEIAELSIDDVRHMSEEDLVAAIRAADVPLFQRSVLGQLGFYDRMTLERLLFFARRTVRHQGY